MIPQKKCKIVLLPIEASTFIGILKRRVDIQDPFTLCDGATFNKSAWQAQHMYFICDDKIQEGDWHLIRTNAGDYRISNDWDTCRQHTDKKIVASTDPKLSLPSIPFSFLKKYVSIQGAIDQVTIEMKYKNEWSKSLVTISNHPIDLHIIPKLTDAGDVIIGDSETNKTTAEIEAEKYRPIRHCALEHTDADIQKAFADGYNAAPTLMWKKIDIDNLPEGEVIAKYHSEKVFHKGTLIKTIMYDEVTIVCMNYGMRYEVTHYISGTDLTNLPQE